ncbi:MAG TPA: hypothetical protein VMH30_03850 [Verrucomicrobiae bacterium]|nr:hypothetical protein [Verrucomicrobiae bacterium]
MNSRVLVIGALLAGAIEVSRAADQNIGTAGWVNISDALVAAVTNAGTVIPWPGNTAGVAVDRTSGILYVDVCNVGLWQSTDHGQSYRRVAEGQISGRCEFGYALNCDPAGGRMACLMLDGKCGMTLDGGRTWQPFAPMGRNWDYGAVDWSDPGARAIFAARHESGGEIYASDDAGASWRFLGKHPEFTSSGIFDARTLVAGTEDGIMRSTDGGETWTNISPLHPVGRVAVYFDGKTYWLAREGLITSQDRGATWQTIGAPLAAGWGPLFGKDTQHIMVADFRGFLETSDGGKTWRRIAPLPPFQGGLAPKLPGEFLSIAWDPKANLLYASRMGSGTWRLQLDARTVGMAWLHSDGSAVGTASL